MIVGSLFSGAGFLDYGLHLAGLDHAWFCERDKFRREILERRWPSVPVYQEVQALADAYDQGRSPGPTHAPGRQSDPLGSVDIIAGGFPCKGVSSAGRRQGFGHPETALWREMLRIVRALRPRYVLVENVAALLTLNNGGLFGEVVGGLAEVGYNTEWDCFPAAAFGAPHGRDRVFITAVTDPARIGSERGRTARRGRDGSEDGGADAPNAARVREGRAAAEAGPTGNELGRSLTMLDASLLSSGANTSPRSDGGKTSSAGLRLNPSFVEWMMGAPEGWTDPDCQLSATEFSSRQAGSADDGSSSTRPAA